MNEINVAERDMLGNTRALSTVAPTCDSLEERPPSKVRSLRGGVIDLVARGRDLRSLKRLRDRDPEIEAGRAEKAAQRARIAANVDPEATELLARRVDLKAAGVDPDTGEVLTVSEPSDQPEQPERYPGSSGFTRAAVTADGKKAQEHVCGLAGWFDKGSVGRAMRVACKSRGCPKCGDEWGLSWYLGAQEVYDAAPGGRWVEAEVHSDDAPAWKQACARRRKQAGDLRGVSAPSGYSTRRFLMDLGDGPDLPERWGAVPVADPMERLQETILEVHELAERRAKLPAGDRPNLGSVSGLGSWREAISEVRKEMAPEPTGWTFRGVFDTPQPFKERIELAKELDALVDVDSTPQKITLKFPSRTNEGLWLKAQGFVSAEEFAARRCEQNAKRLEWNLRKAAKKKRAVPVKSRAVPAPMAMAA